jgi:deoxycytidine triphosphate deaminase
MLNSDEAIKFIIDPLGLAVKQQVGVDLTIEQIKILKEDHRRYMGVHLGNTILKKETLIRDKTYIPLEIKEKKIEGKNGEEIIIKGWFLDIGVYSLTFNQGCKLPDFISAEIKGRSSLNRVGNLLNSSIFDPGFETKAMGATLYVGNPILIEYQSRLAQIIMHECRPTKNLYKGQFQKEKDIK